MAVRLVVTFHATPGKGAELAQAMKARCEVSRQDAGCEQFEVFQSIFDPDTLVLLELWKDKAALDAHAKLQAQRPPLPEGLRLGAGEREDGSGANSRHEQKTLPVRAVENSSPKYGVPDLRRSLALNAQTSQSELSLPDTVQELDAGDRDRRVPKFLEA